MKNSHPSELDIQEYALDKSVCSTSLRAHIESCESCLKEVGQYQILFSELRKEPTAEFEFNLSALVIPKLPKPNPVFSTDRFIAGFLIIFTSCFITVPLYIFKAYILNMFSGVSPFFLYVMIGAASAIVVFKTLEVYKKYQKQIRLLNFS
jgi:hypothetical protein